MLSLLRSASQSLRRLTIGAHSYYGRRFMVSSRVRFAEALAKESPLSTNPPKIFIRNSLLRSVVMPAEERIVAFDNLWNKLLDDPHVDISLINSYLFARVESKTPFDITLLESLKKKGLNADTRTYGILVQQSCTQGDMDETKNILVALKNDNLEVDPFIFSCILHGYVKAGHPAEVEATKKIMANFGLWPSRVGYSGLLSAYAALGDMDKFANTLNEAVEVFAVRSDSSLPLLSIVGSLSAVRLVVKLASALPDSDAVRNEIFSFIPNTVDKPATWVARNGVLQLLMNQRPAAALELFKRSEPATVPDFYLVLLGRATQLAGEDQQLYHFMRAANLSPSHANMIHRRVQLFDQQTTRRPMPKFVPDDRTEEELFALAANADVNKLVHSIVPKLVAKGVAPITIVETIQPADMASAAAYSCVFNVLAPLEDRAVPNNLDEAVALCEMLEQRGHFPRKENLAFALSRCSHLCRCLTKTISTSNVNPYLLLTQVLDILAKCIGPHSEKLLISRLVSQLYDRSCVRPLRRLDPEEMKLLEALINCLVAKDIHFTESNWIFYALEQMGVPSNKIELLRLSDTSQNKVDVIIHHLEGLLLKDSFKA